MAVISSLKVPLLELEKAIDSGDMRARLDSAGKLLRMVSQLDELDARRAGGAEVSAESGRGDRALQCERCLEKVARRMADPTASALPWDGSLLRVILEIVLAFLKDRIPAPAP